MPSASPLYAAIDLGSNSFHMLVVREISGNIQTVARIKRKVRLAIGLGTDNQLSEEAMNRGWQCLKLFSEQLQDIHPERIRVVATATLRLAKNAQVFLQTAAKILDSPINVISGEEEARLIYQGVAHTTGGSDQRLVVDIGGGSTELVTGEGGWATHLFSLPMGCVTWLERYFVDHLLVELNFSRAEAAAQTILKPVTAQLRTQGWQVCVGASGTVQALQKIMGAQGMDENITLDKLLQFKQRAILCGRLEKLEIEGLTLERALVFPSGLAILIAIFRELHIDSMALAGGALREGLLYGMLQLPIDRDIRRRTLENLQLRFAIDAAHAQRVQMLAENFASQVWQNWQLDTHCREILRSACQIHEIGLSVDFKHAPTHAAYLVRHLELPGFTPAQKKLLAILLQNQLYTVDLALLSQQNAVLPQMAEQMCRLLRLAIIFTSRRDTDLPAIRLYAEGDKLHVEFPPGWLTLHPLRAELLKQETLLQNCGHWTLTYS